MSDMLINRAERAREAAYFAPRVGITKEEALEILKMGAQTMNSESRESKSKSASGVEDPDVRYLAEHTDLSPKQAKELIAKHGRNQTGSGQAHICSPHTWAKVTALSTGFENPPLRFFIVVSGFFLCRVDNSNAGRRLAVLCCLLRKLITRIGTCAGRVFPGPGFISSFVWHDLFFLGCTSIPIPHNRFSFNSKTCRRGTECGLSDFLLDHPIRGPHDKKARFAYRQAGVARLQGAQRTLPEIAS